MQTAAKTKKPRKQAVSGCFWANRTYRGRIKDDHKIDIACGSGGFLVASFDRMLLTYKEMGIPHSVIRESLYGFDTNPTVWALATLNMFFRGDGKSKALLPF